MSMLFSTALGLIYVPENRPYKLANSTYIVYKQNASTNVILMGHISIGYFTKEPIVLPKAIY